MRFEGWSTDGRKHVRGYLVSAIKKTETEAVVNKISRLKGPNKAEQGGMIWLASAFANQDLHLQRRSARIAANAMRVLKKALPHSDPELIGSVVADLDSLWDTGQKLDQELKRLFRMRFPQHRQHLREFFAFVEAVQIEMVEFWTGNLRRRLPKLLRELDRQERRERRASGSKSRPDRKRRPRRVRADGI
jgi:hypothetical protein